MEKSKVKCPAIFSRYSIVQHLRQFCWKWGRVEERKSATVVDGTVKSTKYTRVLFIIFIFL